MKRQKNRPVASEELIAYLTRSFSLDFQAKADTEQIVPACYLQYIYPIVKWYIKLGKNSVAPFFLYDPVSRWLCLLGDLLPDEYFMKGMKNNKWIDEIRNLKPDPDMSLWLPLPDLSTGLNRYEVKNRVSNASKHFIKYCYDFNFEPKPEIQSLQEEFKQCIPYCDIEKSAWEIMKKKQAVA